MENSKIILVTLIVLTLLVGTMGGYLIASNTRCPVGQNDFGKLMMLKAMSDKKDSKFGCAYQQGPKGSKEKMSKMGNREYMQTMSKDRDINRDKMHEKKGEMFLKIMTKKCNLTDKQQNQVKAIFESNKGDLKAARDEFKGKLDTIKDKTDTQIENILTDEQKVQFKELKENAKKCHMQQFQARNKNFKRLAQKKRTLNKVRASAF